MDWTEFDQLNEKYQERFDECLPTELMPPSDFENAVEIMRECLKSGKPYELPEEVQQLIEQGAQF